MLMSVRMRSIRSGPDSFFSASTPSTASMMRAFLKRFNEKEINCRIVGESSTTRKMALSIANALALLDSTGEIVTLVRREQIQKTLDRVQFTFGLGIQFGREDCRRRVRGQQGEQLVVDGRE